MDLVVRPRQTVPWAPGAGLPTGTCFGPGTIGKAGGEDGGRAFR